MFQVTLKATSEDGAVSEAIPLEFNDDELAKFCQFLSNCARMENAAIFRNQFPSVERINWDEQNGLTFEISHFKYSDVCELLHVARQIFLYNEPVSFEKVQAIFGKKAQDTSLATLLKQIRDLYFRGDYQPYFQISVNEVPLFQDQILLLWLNGIEYHQDQEKAKLVHDLEQVLSEDVAKGIFVSQLSGRIKATFQLAHLAKLVLKKISELRN